MWIIYPVIIGLVKCSLCILFIRIFFVRSFKIVAQITMVLCIMWSIMTILLACLTCRPLRKFWAFRTKGSCGDIRTAGITIYTVNVVTDIAICCLPMPMVWNLQAPRAYKFALLGIFGLGIMYVRPLPPSNGGGFLPFLPRRNSAAHPSVKIHC